MTDLSQYSDAQLEAMLNNSTAAPAAPADPANDFAQRIVTLGERSARTAVSPKGAVSEAQVVPATIASPGFGVKPADPSNLADVAREGHDYAVALYKHFNGNESLAAAAYNAGPGAVMDWLNGTNASGKNPNGLRIPADNFAANIPFPETRAYVSRVVGNAIAPAAQAAEAPAPAAAAKVDLSKYSDAQLQAMLNAAENTNGNLRKPAENGAPPQPSFWGGVAQGAEHVMDNAAGGLRYAANNLPFAPGAGAAIDRFGQIIGLPSIEQADAAHAAAAEANPGSDLGKFVGELGASVPFGAMEAGPVLGGALTGALTTDSNTPGGVALDTGLGGALGKAGDIALTGASRVMKPAIDKGAQLLHDAGVNLTPGQILGSKKGSVLGSAAKHIEDATRSIPLLGSLVQHGQEESVLGFNRAATNAALQPIGQALPAATEIGHASIKQAGDAISNEYENLLPKLSVAPDQQFVSRLGQISQDAQNTLQRSRFFQFRNILQSIPALNRLASGDASAVLGTTVKEAESALRDKITRFSTGNASPEDRSIADALSSVRDELRQLTVRSNPQYADQLGNIDQAWARLVPAEAAAGKAGASAGKDAAVFLPRQYQQAYQATDQTVRDRATARGTRGDIQNLAESGARIIPQSLGDSGTASRYFVGRLLANPERNRLALGTAIGGYETSRGGRDTQNPYVLAPAAMLAAAYSPVGRRAIQWSLMHEPGPVVGTVADMLARLGKMSGPVLPSYFASQREGANANGQ